MRRNKLTENLTIKMLGDIIESYGCISRKIIKDYNLDLHATIYDKFNPKIFLKGHLGCITSWIEFLKIL